MGGDETPAGQEIFCSICDPLGAFLNEAPMGAFEVCRSIIIEEAKKRDMIHIDGLSLVPPIPELFSDKWLHPNALGYGFYGENLTRQILNYLK